MSFINCIFFSEQLFHHAAETTDSCNREAKNVFHAFEFSEMLIQGFDGT
jgi:hypothetical protein